MQFIWRYKQGAETETPASRQEIAAIGQLIQETTEAGVQVATKGLQAKSKGARARRSRKRFVVTDGPFAETKS